MSNGWEQHLLPSRLNHLLVSDADGDAGQLVEFVSRLATPSHAEVTLCCQPTKTARRFEGLSKGFPAADALRDKGLTVHVEPAITSEMERILLIDRSRSVDLIVMKECETIENADWYRANSIKVARRTQRPVIACGPFSSQRPISADSGLIVAAVSMRESSHQIAHASGQLGKLMGKPLTILHVEDISHEFSKSDSLSGVECECQLLGNWVCAQDVATTAKVAYGPVGETITRFATQEGAELIVMGLDMEEKGQELQRSDVLRRFVLMAAPCPVLFLPTFHRSKDLFDANTEAYSGKSQTVEGVEASPSSATTKGPEVRSTMAPAYGVSEFGV